MVGTGEPHRKYEINRGIKTGIDTSKIRLPQFYPDVSVAKLAPSDYMAEVEWADGEVGEMILILKDKDLIDNTLIIYTSDNGMPFPRAKATLYDHGVRMPLVMHWPDHIKTERLVADPISLIDMAPTLLDLAGIPIPEQLFSKKDDPDMINNLALDPDYVQIKLELKEKLNKYLVEADDPRQKGESFWDQYRYDKPEGIPVEQAEGSTLNR